MAKRFTPEYRSTVLKLLDSNRGNITRTSQQAGIAERTLYDWRRRQLLQQHEQPQTMQQSFFVQQQHEQPQTMQSLPIQPQNENIDEFNILRQRLMRNLLAITDSLEINLESGSLSARVNAIKILLGSLIELESQFEPESESSTPILRIEYVDEHGRVHNSPPKEFDPEEDNFDDEEDA